uniref:Uncharacterized protein n=1 Tax=Echeneis naucrates TaxID=173247 RepID=A0A665U497_ECHNA
MTGLRFQMRPSSHLAVSQLALLSFTLLCPLPWSITSCPISPNALPAADGPELESAVLHRQAAQEDKPEVWPGLSQDSLQALLQPEFGPWEDEGLHRDERGDLLAQPRSPFPGGHSLESMHYKDRGDTEDGGKRNKALTSIAGGLQTVSREKGGFGFRFGRKRWTDLGWRGEGRGGTDKDTWN